MKCPKCHKTISDNLTVCPYCHKVLALECPNCHSLGESPVCEKCGYIILTKCSKCGKTVSTSAQKCKCGFPVKTSVAYHTVFITEKYKTTAWLSRTFYKILFQAAQSANGSIQRY